MKREGRRKGSLTVEASITYPIFLMIVVTILYIMRIVYTYDLVQHAAAQTVKELSMYTYIYQVSGASEINTGLQSAAAGRTEQFNSDVGNVVDLYDKFMKGDTGNLSYSGTTDPAEILKNFGAVLVGGATKEANQQLFETVVRPLMETYIGADHKGNSADERLTSLRVVNGLKGLNFDASSFCEDGVTIDLVVCYTIDPLFPIDIIPELNLMNRAYARGMSGKTVFERSGGGEKEADDKESVWDMRNVTERGKVIQEQDHARNLPDGFPVYSAFDQASGTATATVSIDLTMDSYQKVSTVKGAISRKCADILNYKTSTREGVTVEKSAIRESVLIVYIPSSAADRTVDRSVYDQALAEVQTRYPDIQIVTKEID